MRGHFGAFFTSDRLGQPRIASDERGWGRDRVDCWAGGTFSIQFSVFSFQFAAVSGRFFRSPRPVERDHGLILIGSNGSLRDSGPLATSCGGDGYVRLNRFASAQLLWELTGDNRGNRDETDPEFFAADSTHSRQDAKAQGKLESFFASPRVGDLALKFVAGDTFW